MAQRIKVLINAIKDQALNIKTYELVSSDGEPLPPFSPGAHIDFFLPNDLIRQYSLSNSANERNRYVVGIQKEEQGRGGSRLIHDHFKVGDEVEISPPRNNFELDETAQRYKLIAGGIGITPIMSMARQLKAIGKPFQLYYACRNEQRAAFLEELRSTELSKHVVLSYDDVHGPLNTLTLFGRAEPNVQIYCCGPTGLMGAVKSATRSWPAESVRFEHFSASEDTGPRDNDGSFEVIIQSTGRVLQIPADKSILSVLEENGIFIDHACCEGICGTCETGLIDGEADHRDMILTEAEKQENQQIMVCCSRAKTPTLTLDL
ncbi:PDR/VanB family oxidoreductase [Kiloniella sp. EL199]|uniref:PDR/VanB family oxidoreductase n=1 Tax=Kiloniella sp. EL199 TaxID=2107581 RepID=UPI000EA0999B|nr:PDR/VanB family oxidoreductase [Kiloniella sp. EL199]